MFRDCKFTAGFTPLLTALFAICLIVLAARPAAAATVEERLAALESKVANLQGRVSTLETKVVQQAALNNTQINQIKSLQVTVQQQQRENVAQNSAITFVGNKLIHVSRSGSDIYITGANLHIVNGLDDTETTNRLGNLIVGYNELRTSGNNRSGSHNLVVGALQNFSSYGGLVAGWGHTISGAYASVSGGKSNTASGFYSSVSGGHFNTASSFAAAVSGGQNNTASAGSASVSGGSRNTASGLAASVSGGINNIASGGLASVGGGDQNLASASYASVAGGRGRSAIGIYDWRAGSLYQDF